MYDACRSLHEVRKAQRLALLGLTSSEKGLKAGFPILGSLLAAGVGLVLETCSFICR